jgi:hypothetical protein
MAGKLPTSLPPLEVWLLDFIPGSLQAASRTSYSRITAQIAKPVWDVNPGSFQEHSSSQAGLSVSRLIILISYFQFIHVPHQVSV